MGDEGIWNIRCPGEGCHYRLLDQDIDVALINSELKDQAKQLYAKLRNENGSSRLQSVLASALDDGAESWVWSECQACPTCFMLAHRAGGCAHLACLCGCHYCFVCGGELRESHECCCGEYELYLNPGRAFLAAWMCFKNDAHVVLGGRQGAVREALEQQLPSTERKRAAERRAERAAEAERVAEAWAHEQVRGTLEALRIRRACESLSAALWYAGADVDEPLLSHSTTEVAFEGLLANSTAVARADEADDDAIQSDDDLSFEFQYDDVVGFIDDYTCAKAKRRAAHGAPRRVCSVTAWIGGQKMKARAPTKAKQQKKAVVAGFRDDTRRAMVLRKARH